jgi:allantoate deiminase
VAANAFHLASQELARRLDRLAEITDVPGEITRTYLSQAMARANTQVAEWMKAAGLAVREDAVGNLIGRQDGSGKTLLLGSHLDTVRNAGRFDGPLGVLLPLAALSVLRAEGVVLPYAVDVLGFAEEEGVRFASAYLGSKGFIGRLRAADLARQDESGETIADLLKRRHQAGAAITGPLKRRGEDGIAIAGPPEGRGLHVLLPAAAYRRSQLLGYVETHIEQGPVLEQRGLPVGVVSAIAGQIRGRITFRGKAGHAGTTPMNLRQDALAGAAEWIGEVERYAGARRPSGGPRPVPAHGARKIDWQSGPSPLVATVGTLTVKPGASNVIPAEAVLSLDIRHPVDRVLQSELAVLLAAGRRIARRRGLKFGWEATQHNGAVACDAALSDLLAASVQAAGVTPIRLVSGAGHDGVVISALTPIAMLFVRCRGGLSHHPDEYASPADLTVALRVLCDFLKRLAVSLG